ncbi:MAG TPA: MFS transporter, partial [Xanthobacteraceae bacterium]|nr:MFS transporter [Xanthobacteraceae bacterium]
APLLAFALPRERFKAQPLKPGEVHVPPKTRPARGAVFILVIVAFTAYAFIPSAMSAHLLAIFDRLGIDPKVAVGLGALFGPAQVLSRLAEFLYARDIHPLVIARFAIALTAAGFALIFAFGISLWVATAFVIMFGVTNGLMTIARGTVPLMLFGAAGYGKIVGRIAGPALVMQAAAPLVLAFVAERLGDYHALGVVALFGIAALISFCLVRRP